MGAKVPDWICTYTGERFWPLAVGVGATITIEDIAHALASLVRFNGHTREPYTVAQHSVLVSLLCDPDDALWGLLHDAAEAYMGEVVSPIKATLPAFERAETLLLKRIVTRFGLGWPMPWSVRQADAVLVATEARDLIPPYGQVKREGYGDGTPDPKTIRPWGWQKAKATFLQRYAELRHDAVQQTADADRLRRAVRANRPLRLEVSFRDGEYVAEAFDRETDEVVAASGKRSSDTDAKRELNHMLATACGR